MITAADVNYSEELFENLSVQDIHTLATDEILIWCSGSGAGEGRAYGTYYILLDDGKGHYKYLEEDVIGQRGTYTNRYSTGTRNKKVL